MYLKFGDKKCSCSGIQKTKDGVVYFGLPEDVDVPISGGITLYSDSGVILRADDADSYLRQVLINGALTLTNALEPEIPVDPESPSVYDDYDKRVTWDELAEAYTKGVNSIDE